MISVVIPAHNEEPYIGGCIQAVRRAAEELPEEETEIIVVCNRCTDGTAALASELGARVVVNDARSISAVRNAGVRAARGSVILTVDADSAMSPGALGEAKELLASGKYVGGGTRAKFDRMSLGILVSTAYVVWQLLPTMLRQKAALSGGMFWFYKEDWEALGGFDESLVSLEDRDFAVRLNELGKSRGQKYGTLRRSWIVTSSRKFDQFGDWYLIRDRAMVKRLFTGRDREAADRFYYDVR